MAHAARRLASESVSNPPAPARERLRAVPPPSRQASRRPSPAVIRRRRAIAVGGLTGLIGLPLALVALGGSAPSDTGRIVTMLTAGATEPVSLCDHLSAGMLRAIGGTDACVAASPARAPGGEVHDVRIAGAAATAIVTRDGGDELVRLVREDGAWKVDDVG
jgi:hypothetical protein